MMTLNSNYAQTIDVPLYILPGSTEVCNNDVLEPRVRYTEVTLHSDDNDNKFMNLNDSFDNSHTLLN